MKLQSIVVSQLDGSHDMSDHSFDWCDLSQSWPQGQVSRVVPINDSINSQSCGEADYKWPALALAVSISVCFILPVWPIYCVIKANWSCRFICFESASGVKSSGLFFSSSSSSPHASSWIQTCASWSKGQLCGLQCFDMLATPGPPGCDPLFCQQLIPVAVIVATHGSSNESNKGRGVCRRLKNKTPGWLSLKGYTRCHCAVRFFASCTDEKLQVFY